MVSFFSDVLSWFFVEISNGRLLPQHAQHISVEKVARLFNLVKATISPGESSEFLSVNQLPQMKAA